MAIKNPKTPRVTRKAKKTAAMYKKNPTWAKEDAPSAYKKGGATKMKKYAIGGMKKPLRKAQPGMSVKTTPSTNAPSLNSMGIKNVYSGPMTERDSKELDIRYPSTTAGPSLATSRTPGFNRKTRSYVTPEAVESYDRNRTENYLRSPHPEVGAYNKDSKTPGNEMPLFDRSMIEAEDGTYKKGGATKKMQKGGPNVIQSMRRNMLTNRANRLDNKGVANMKAGNVEKGRAQFEKSDDLGAKRRKLAEKYKTGGMVNANAKIAAAKKATGKVGGTTKAISKVAVKTASPKGRVGGISTAPKKALPKAQYGAIINAVKAVKTVAKAPKYITTAQKDLKAAKFVTAATAKAKAAAAKAKADKAITLSKIAQAPGGKTVIGGGIAAGILGLNKVGSNKSSSKSKGTKAAKSVMSKAFPTISKSKMGGMKGKSC